ncbi:HD domain protein [Desulforapulum autotrophicum HRM2]|uniref:HD domain protein n=1 Tax=Desulforapulum autotrophicum (strain ATCC 43914 / DSM 3382 / VKM B-1955 / HRM2) TaxID=177437 RepID=C0QHN5_DESAH|nr:HD domain-containing protein [Desulforapulum autotrophicum]ACN13593.1 HD domain protein [Desulforapulum autotrophicum HRM2]
MKTQALDTLKQQFSDYAATFIDPGVDDGPHVLKRNHTLRVCREIVDIGEALGLSGPDLILAQAIALLHDIGRFEQFKRYNTFLDAVSANHAALGVEVIEALRLLDPLTPEERELIIDAVRFHNAADLPGDRDKRTLFFMGLIRDADKLDIWQVVIDHYLNHGKKTDKFIELGLEDRGGYSPEAFQALFQRRFVRSAAVKQLNDFKLMQISWVFDLNFTPTIDRVKDRHYIEKIASTMPQCPDLSTALDHVFNHMDTHTHDTYTLC